MDENDHCYVVLTIARWIPVDKYNVAEHLISGSLEMEGH